MNQQFEINSLDELNALAVEMANNMGKHNIWAFYGSMGAGKTTLIKQLCAALGVVQEVTSPTFNLINEYETGDGEIIYHFDFYRLNDVEEALNIGTDEYFHSGNLCLLEWPEKIEPLLPDDRRNITIQTRDENQRIVKIEDYE